MPITPIDIFTKGQTGLDQIFARGTSALGQGLQSAIQVGRDQANNQASQERDFLSEQRREYELKQRRAENLQKDLKDERKFDRGVKEYDQTFERDKIVEDRDYEAKEDRFEQEQGHRKTVEENRQTNADRDYKQQKKDYRLKKKEVEQKRTIIDFGEKRDKREGEAHDAQQLQAEATLKTTIQKEARAAFKAQSEKEQKAAKTATSAKFQGAVANKDADAGVKIFNEEILPQDWTPAELAAFQKQFPEHLYGPQGTAGGSSGNKSKDLKTWTTQELKDTIASFDNMLYNKGEGKRSTSQEERLELLKTELRRRGRVTPEDEEDAAGDLLEILKKGAPPASKGEIEYGGD